MTWLRGKDPLGELNQRVGLPRRCVASTVLLDPEVVGLTMSVAVGAFPFHCGLCCGERGFFVTAVPSHFQL